MRGAAIEKAESSRAGGKAIVSGRPGKPFLPAEQAPAAPMGGSAGAGKTAQCHGERGDPQKGRHSHATPEGRASHVSLDSPPKMLFSFGRNDLYVPR